MESNAISVRPFHVYLYGENRKPIPTSFEEAAARLERLPLLYFEPDGSFVWAPDRGRQQVYGMIYDAAGQIHYCELQGKSSIETWTTLCEAITGLPQCRGLYLMRLPEQELQDLQSFEETIWR